jgi:hypothetical protein
MTPLRVAAVHGLLALIIGGQAIALVMDAEKWPFSPYPMYARMRTASHVEYRLYAVPMGPVPREFSLLDWAYVRPIGPQKLQGILQRTRSQEARRRRMITALWRRYEALRREGRHQGPRLEAVRLYRVRWIFDRRSLAREAPAERDLVLELTRAELGNGEP